MNIPKIAHLIWFKDSPEIKHGRIKYSPILQDRIDRLKLLNPDYEIMVHDDDTHLNPLYRRAWDYTEQFAPLIYHSELLRYSVLQKFGGWYLDVDCIPLVPFEYIKNVYDIGDRMFITRRISWNDDILGCSPDWSYWPQINDFIEHFDTQKKVKLSCKLFNGNLIAKISYNHPDSFFKSPIARFWWKGKAVPYIVRGNDRSDDKLCAILNKFEIPLLLNRMGQDKEGVELGAKDESYSEWLLKCWFGKKLTCVTNTAPYCEGASKFFSTFRKDLNVVNKDELEYANEVKDKSLDFIYFNHNEEDDYYKTVNKILTWFPKVKRYGLIAGDGYEKNSNVWKAVRYHLGDSHLTRQDNVFYLRNPF